MVAQSTDFNYLIPQLFALASKLEGEGQYNNAKLVRSAADSISRRAAVDISMPSDYAALAVEMDKVIDILAGLNVGSDLIVTMQRGSQAMAERRLPLIHETPNPYVCRYCGSLTFEPPAGNCPQCLVEPGTFQEFMPVYWLNNFDPFQALESMRQTPLKLAAILNNLSAEDMNRLPADGGWNIRNAVSHIRDAQGVFEFRLGVMVEEDNPQLESKAVFEWAAEEQDRPPETLEIFNAYNQSRQQTLSILEDLSLKDWRRKGQHEEFGSVTITQQASYFATHELTHFPQIEALKQNGK